MKVRTRKRCPHCDKIIDIREVDIDKASEKELRAFFKDLMAGGK